MRNPFAGLNVFRSSSAVEQEAVNFEVAGSNPASGAKPEQLSQNYEDGSDFLYSQNRIETCQPLLLCYIPSFN